jgi:hypothetical protein
MNFKTACFWLRRKLSGWFARPAWLCTLALLAVVCSGRAQTNTNLETVTFSNSTSIGFPEFEVTSPYPATIDVPVYGTIQKVTVTIYDLAVASPSEIQGVMVVGPTAGGAAVAVELMGTAGDDDSITNIDLTFDDDATNQLTENQIVSGTFQVSVLVPGDFYNPPAPSVPSTNVLAGFIGTSTQGTWSLYVVNFGDDLGTISGGWALTITYVGGTPPPPTGLTVSSPSVLASGQVELTVSGTAGTAFSIEDSTNLLAWTVIATNTLPSGGSFTFTSAAAARGDLFYRAVVGALPLEPVTPVQTPTLSSPSLLSGGQFGFTLTGQSATTYWIEDSTNLQSWTTIATNSAPTGTLLFTAPRSVTGSRFYRAVVAP